MGRRAVYYHEGRVGEGGGGMNIFKVVCKKCGKEAPLVENKSNKDWLVRDTSKPCECGGKFITLLLDYEEEAEE